MNFFTVNRLVVIQDKDEFSGNIFKIIAEC